MKTSECLRLYDRSIATSQDRCFVEVGNKFGLVGGLAGWLERWNAGTLAGRLTGWLVACAGSGDRRLRAACGIKVVPLEEKGPRALEPGGGVAGWLAGWLVC